jgi:hypothetical protein
MMQGKSDMNTFLFRWHCIVNVLGSYSPYAYGQDSRGYIVQSEIYCGQVMGRLAMLGRFFIYDTSRPNYDHLRYSWRYLGTLYL